MKESFFHFFFIICQPFRNLVLNSPKNLKLFETFFKSFFEKNIRLDNTTVIL